jgi:PTS system nitrogen regulatory IIA component
MLPEGLLELNNVSVGDTASSKKRVLEQAARLLAANDDDVDPDQVFERLLDRERLGSTGLAGGVALPHARMPGIRESRGAFLRLAEAVEFDALDGKPVDLVFALLVPEDATDEHLQLLAKLAATFNDDALRGRLREADAEQALKALAGQASTNAA